MHASKAIAIAAFAVAASAHSARAARPALTTADVDKAVAALAGYHSGKPRRVLFGVEQLVRRAANQPEVKQHLARQLAKLLETDAGHDLKLFACQQLWIIGSDAALAALQKMLVDAKTSHMACYALGREPNPKADQVLRDAAAKAKGTALVTIINHIGERRDAGAVAAMGKLVRGGDAGVAAAALMALGRISGAGAADLLKAARAEIGPKLKGAADRACLQCAQEMAKRGETDEAKAIYRALLGSAKARHVRRGALLGLIDAGGPAAVRLIIATLRGDDPTMRAAAIAAIRTLKGEDVSQRFAAELPKSPPAVRVLLLGALADRADPGVVAALLAAAKSAEAEVRMAAIVGLGKAGDATAVAVLAQSLAHDRSKAERAAARASLLRLQGKGVDAALIESLGTADATARAELIAMLADRGVSAAAPALLQLAAGGDASVRPAAFKALGRVAEVTALPPMLDLLIRMEGPVGRREAELAIVAIARKIIEASRADQPLLALHRARGADATCSLLRVLRGIGNAKAFDAVRRALADAEAGVRDTAIRALAEWPNARAMAALLELFATTRNDAHRIMALRGCVRLLRGDADQPPEDKLAAYGKLLKQARRPAEKKLVLSGLAGVRHPGALESIEPLLSDAAVRAEAELAIVAVARGMAGAYPRETQAAMRKLMAAREGEAPAEPLRSQAAAIVRRTQALGDFLTAWQVAGPYFEAGESCDGAFRRVFPPERPDATDVAWKALPLGPDPRRPFVFDLLAACGGEQRCAYVRTWVHSDRARPARIEIGSDDGNKGWLNGRLVIANNFAGACTPGQFKARLALRKGWNTLLLKITQNNGPWQFCARLAGTDGSPLPGLKWRPTPPAK